MTPGLSPSWVQDLRKGSVRPSLAEKEAVVWAGCLRGTTWRKKDRVMGTEIYPVLQSLQSMEKRIPEFGKPPFNL